MRKITAAQNNIGAAKIAMRKNNISALSKGKLDQEPSAQKLNNITAAQNNNISAGSSCSRKNKNAM